jgi:hypothetical protein
MSSFARSSSSSPLSSSLGVVRASGASLGARRGVEASLGVRRGEATSLWTRRLPGAADQVLGWGRGSAPIRRLIRLPRPRRLLSSARASWKRTGRQPRATSTAGVPRAYLCLVALPGVACEGHVRCGHGRVPKPQASVGRTLRDFQPSWRGQTVRLILFRS